MKQIYFLLFIVLTFSLQAQDVQQYKFRVYLKDKGDIDYSVDNPEKFLSLKAIDRKKRQNVVVDESDFPISPDYFMQLAQAGGEVISYSKWFKTVVMQLNDSAQIGNALNLPFVDSIKYVWKGFVRNKTETIRPRLLHTAPADISNVENIHGLAEKQFVMHNAQNLHKSGFMGKGINVGVIDAGFTNVDVIPFFASNNIVEYKSFVPDGEVLADSDHGTKVFSTISAVVPGKMMGSATASNFYLLHSEDVSTEFPVEEDYWVRAVEYADSVGVDLINSSLGYSNFDDKELSYSHDDLNGLTSIMSQAADMAYDKGMIIVTSAGNEGNKPWEKISVPGDAAKALTVGAVSSDSLIASFSSRGFTADGRLKPDVVSVGRGTMTISKHGNIEPSNGTSFSSPFMTGLIASLWSINPDLDRGELLDIVRESGDRFHNPDSVYGNGIPDIGLSASRVLKTLPLCEGEYEDELFAVSKIGAGRLEFTIKDEKFKPEVYVVSLLDEVGDVVLQQPFPEEGTNVVSLAELVEDNDFFHVVVIAPHWQKTVRFKL